MIKLVLLGAVAVGAVYLAIILTADWRAGSARDTLDRAAEQFVRCYERESSYMKCETSGVFVATRRQHEFLLSAGADFGPTYEVSRRRDGVLKWTCRPRGDGCPIGRWVSE